MERGLALKLVLSSGGTKMLQVVAYVGSKALIDKLCTFSNMSLKKAEMVARRYYENPVRAEASNDQLPKMMNWYAAQCGDCRSPVGPNMRRSDPKHVSASVRKLLAS